MASLCMPHELEASHIPWATVFLHTCRDICTLETKDASQLFKTKQLCIQYSKLSKFPVDCILVSAYQSGVLKFKVAFSSKSTNPLAASWLSVEQPIIFCLIVVKVSLHPELSICKNITPLLTCPFYYHNNAVENKTVYTILQASRQTTARYMQMVMALVGMPHIKPSTVYMTPQISARISTTRQWLYYQLQTPSPGCRQIQRRSIVWKL